MAWTMRHKLGLRMAILLALLGGAAGMMFVNFYEVEVTRQRLDQARSTMQEGLRLAEFLEGLGLALGAGGEEARIVRRELEQAAEDVLGLQRRTGLRALPHDVRGPPGEVAQRAELLAGRGFDVAARRRQGGAARQHGAGDRGGGADPPLRGARVRPAAPRAAQGPSPGADRRRG